MTQATTSFESGFQRPEGRRLYIKTFAPALLTHRSIEIANDDETIHPVAIDFKYIVRVPDQQKYEIIINDKATATISVYVNEDFGTQLVVKNNKILFDHNFECCGEVLTQAFKSGPPKHETFDFKLFIKSSAVIQRMDVKLGQGVWFTAIMFEKRVVQVRPNGDFFTRTPNNK